MIRLVAFDLDGTLMGADQQISIRVRHAMAAAQERGVVVTLSTGRMFAAVLPFAQALNVTAPLLAYQGGWIQAPSDPLPQYRVPLPAGVALATLELAERQAWHTVLYADGRIFIKALYRPLDFYQRLLGHQLQLVDHWEPVLALYTPDKVLFVARPEEIAGMGEILRAEMDGRAQVFRSHAQFIEVVPLGVDKGTGLAWLARKLHIPRAEVMAVGDHENDLPMVAWAGVGVAMGNAAPALVEVADWIAPPLDEDGAAAALEQFVLCA